MPEKYNMYVFDLTNARTSEVFEVMGKLAYVKDASDGLANMDVQLNESDNDKINLIRKCGIIATFRKLYLTNAAQSGKTITLFISTSFDELRLFEQSQGADVNVNQPITQYGVTPTIYNVTCTTSGTEYSQSLGTDCRKFMIRPRTGNLQVCFTASGSGTLYITIPAGGAYFEDNVKCAQTLYFRGDTSGQIAEIVKWT